MPKKGQPRMKVPSLPVLARIIASLAHDHRNIFNDEYGRFFASHNRYWDALVKGDPAICAWHARARKMANEMIFGPPKLVEADPEIDLAYQCGWEASMHRMGHYRNPYNNRYYADCWRDGWTDASRERGLITRVN